MHEVFSRWLLGVPPAIVGGSRYGDAICLVRIDHDAEDDVRIECAYEVLSAELAGNADSKDHVRANALKSLLERLGNGPKRLALGVPAGDVFIKTIDVPAGLGDSELRQLSVVEAVANLPVPPEEVCADYLRMGPALKSGQEQIRIAFCRRDLIDEMSLLAEDAGVQLAVIDRDSQALHDAALWLISRYQHEVTIAYPVLLLWATDPCLLIIARDALDLVAYSLQTGALLEQIDASCRRAGVSDESGALELWVFQSRDADTKLAHLLTTRRGPVHLLEPENIVPAGSLPPRVPLLPWTTALGMALREEL